MKSRKSKPDLAALCAEVHEDDGVDPRLAFTRRQPSGSEACGSALTDSEGGGPQRSGHRKENRKTRQLCRQVARSLSLTLAADCADELLSALEVVDVVPAPDSSRLAVLIRVAPGATAGPECVLARLNVAAGFLRAELASAITRKRVPELTFRCLERDEVTP